MDDTKATIKLALQQGWDVRKTNSGHLRYQSPEGVVIIDGSTPGDNRGRLSHRTRLRKAGLQPRVEKRSLGMDRGTNRRKEQQMESVLRTLQDNPGRPMTVGRIAEVTSIESEDGTRIRLTSPQVQSAIRELMTYPELRSAGKDRYTWMPARLDEKPPDPTPVPSVTTVAFEAPSAATNGNGGTNGHTAAPSTAVEPMVSTPASLPDDAPQLFEFVCLENHGLPVLRDERGQWWVAAPMVPRF